MSGCELLNQAAFMLIELGGDQHIDMGDQVAALALCAQPADAEPLDGYRIFGLAAGWNGYGLLAVESVDGQIVAKYGPTHRNLNPAMQVVSISGELVVALDAHVDVEVAGCAAALAHFALIG